MSFTAMSPESYAAQEAEGRNPPPTPSNLPTASEVRLCMRQGLADGISDEILIGWRDLLFPRYVNYQHLPGFRHLVAMGTAALLDLELRPAVAEMERAMFFPAPAV